MPRILVAAWVTTIAALSPPPAGACSCCAERGIRVEEQRAFPESGAVRDNLISGFSRLKLTGDLLFDIQKADVIERVSASGEIAGDAGW